ncbi:HNH endonuclease signature motif containing protein [Streptomyces sp. NPDC001530]|uniref:HNH endonuclease signature motif containing protein n=1 Tax=Streptomyces sp. NPDC001530 TaxID=3364582 RepID=UPI00367FECC5
MQDKYELARTRIATGAWTVDTATGKVAGEHGERIGYVMSTGYIHLAIKEGKRVRRVYGHRVVWEHAHGPIPDGMQVNHINGIKTDNRLANLELVTPAGNSLHAYAIGLRTPKRGVRNGNAKLSAAQVQQIRQRQQAGEQQQLLATEYGVSKAQVCRIVSGKRWAVV